MNEEKKADLMNTVDMSNSNSLQGEKPFVLAVRQFLTEVSVAGVKYIANESTSLIRRLFWSILVLFGVGFAIYQISEQARIYLSYSVTVKMNITDMPSLKFPTITVCNENVMNKSKTLEIDPKGDLSWAFSEAFAPIQLSDAELDNARITKIFSERNAENWKNVYLAAYLDYEKLIVECSFDGAICDQKDYLIIETISGNCLQFNPYGNLTTEVVGNGLQLVLTADVQNYNNPMSASAGYRVLIGHHLEEINTVIGRRAIKVDVNHHTQIKMQAEEIKRLPEPYGSCRNKEDYVYSRCSTLCFEKYLVDNCGCAYTGFLTENVTICAPLTGALCASPIMDSYFMDNIESTQCDCPPQCTEYIYPYQVSDGTLSEYFIKWMQRVYKKETFTQEYMKNNFVILDIYFDSLKKTEMITQPAYTLLSLLCDIGGALGLILGSTVLTFFEIFDFCLVSSSSAIQTSLLRTKKNADVKPE